jgi:hypothetical protein
MPMNRILFLLGLALVLLVLAAGGWAVDGLRACERMLLGERRS